MFVLCRVADVIQVAPELFSSDYSSVLIEEIDRKYANKVIADVGLCITHYDFIEIGDAYIHPSDGTSHTDVSMDFMQDIIIPSYAMQNPSFFDKTERLWEWKFPGREDDQDPYYMYLNEEIRFRVTNINFTRVLKTAKGMQAVTDATDSKPDKH
ncbi:hypothetical protein AaE_012096, partial [Aphanomyces astaci]